MPQRQGGLHKQAMKSILTILFVAAALMALAATFGVRQIARPDGPLEPSVQNEVDHAVARAEAWLAKEWPAAGTRDACPYRGDDSTAGTNALAAARDVFGTNGLCAADMAIKLISSQKGGGWWITPTNAAPTRLAVEILKGL